MPSKVNYIGFAGTDSYDLILYLAAMLTTSKRKVLLADNSRRKALSFCIPVSGTEGSERKEISYKGMEFRLDMSAEPQEGWDYVLVDFGQNVNHEGIKACDTLFLVTDTGLHNMAAIEPLGAKFRNIYLLLREIPGGLEENYIHKLLQEKGLEEKKSYYFYLDGGDREAMTALQYNNSLCYRKLSPAVKYFIQDILKEVFELEENEIKLAEKELKRRH